MSWSLVEGRRSARGETRWVWTHLQLSGLMSKQSALPFSIPPANRGYTYRRRSTRAAAARTATIYSHIPDHSALYIYTIYIQLYTILPRAYLLSSCRLMKIIKLVPLTVISSFFCFLSRFVFCFPLFFCTRPKQPKEPRAHHSPARRIKLRSLLYYRIRGSIVFHSHWTWNVYQFIRDISLIFAVFDK